MSLPPVLMRPYKNIDIILISLNVTEKPKKKLKFIKNIWEKKFKLPLFTHMNVDMNDRPKKTYTYRVLSNVNR